MRLFEAILEANHRAMGGDKSAGLNPSQYTEALPVIALTCIDPRLNPLLPEALGVSEEQFIWLRNAGNIITSSTSSTMRSLALACAVKGGKEIAIIGHTDCKVRQTSAMELTDRLRALGVERARLPENLVEFFGMFASERQNVIKAVDYVRQSPLIGAKIPVHGLLIDIQSGKLEWVVNGYETLATAVSSVSSSARIRDEGDMVASLPKFNIGDMNFPDIKIGDAHSKPVPVEPVAPRLADLPSQLEHHHPHPHTTTPSTAVTPVTPVKEKPARIRIDKSAMYKILGEDRKVYGPATAAEVERWIEEGRIDLRTLVQKLGYHEWKQLEAYLEKQLPSDIPIPPALNTAMKVIKEIKKKTRR